MQVTCDSGFVIDGKSGETTSALSCDESGTIVGSQECVPVICKCLKHIIRPTWMSVVKALPGRMESAHAFFRRTKKKKKKREDCEFCISSKKRRITRHLRTALPFVSYGGSRAVSHTDGNSDNGEEKQSCRRSKEKSSCRSKPGETVGTQQSEPNSVHFGLTTGWNCKEGFVDSLPSGPKTYSRQYMPSGQLDEIVQNYCVDIIMDSKIHAVRRELVQTQDLVHLATSARALMVSSQDGPNGQTCAEDDCVGSPCGQGGIGTDLWSFGGPEGSYVCECNEG